MAKVHKEEEEDHSMKMTDSKTHKKPDLDAKAEKGSSGKSGKGGKSKTGKAGHISKGGKAGHDMSMKGSKAVRLFAKHKKDLSVRTTVVQSPTAPVVESHSMP